VLLATGWAEETRGEGHVNRTAILRIAKHQPWAVRWLMLGLLAATTQKGRHARRCLKWNAAQRPTPGLQTLVQNVVPINQAGQASTKQVNFINTLINKKGLVIEDTKAFIVGVVVTVTRVLAG
jgi:hypothetical protein